jgi:hypothetical protein
VWNFVVFGQLSEKEKVMNQQKKISWRGKIGGREQRTDRSELERTIFRLGKCVTPDAVEFLTAINETDGLSFLNFLSVSFVEKRAERSGDATEVDGRKRLNLERVKTDICGYDFIEEDVFCVKCLPEDKRVVRYWYLFDKDGLHLRDKESKEAIVCGNYVVRLLDDDQYEIFFGCGSPNDPNSHLQFLRWTSRVDERGNSVANFPNPRQSYSSAMAATKKKELVKKQEDKKLAEKLARETKEALLCHQQEEEEKQRAEREARTSQRLVNLFGTPVARKQLQKTAGEGS